MLLAVLEACVPVLAAGSGLITFNQLATSHRRVGSILVEVLRQKTSACRRLTRGRADPLAQSLRASSEDGRAEHVVHDNEVGEDRGGTA